MGFYTYLEIDNGESLSICGDDGVNEGTPLTAFLGTYQSAITRSEETPELLWFTRLEEQSSVDPRILTEIFYGEDMRYSPDEYDRFIADWGRIYGRMNEEEFQQRLEQVEKMWTPIDEIIPAVEEIIRLLPRMGENTHWYTAENTQPAFQGLLNTLRKAKNDGGEKVRFLIL